MNDPRGTRLRMRSSASRRVLSGNLLRSLERIHTGDDRVAVERNRHAYEHLIDGRRIDAQLDVIRDRICDAVSLIVIGTVPRCSMNRQELASVLRLRMIGSRSDARAEVVADGVSERGLHG